MPVQVLGTLELVAGGQARPLRSARLRRLLAALVVRAGAVVPVDALADAVWGDAPPARVEGAVQTLVSRLRGALPGTGAALHTRAPGYLLELAPADLDAARFTQLADRGGAVLPVRPGEAAALLDEALGLWRGPAYAEFADDDLARPEAVRLEELRRSAIEDRVDAALALGRPDEALARLAGLLAEAPLRERAQGQRILALHRTGRQAEALAAYRDHRDRLRAELGLEPSPALRRLESAVLRHDPSLDAPAVPAAPAGAARGAPARGAPAPARAGERRGNLPPAPAPLIGREEALAATVATLRVARVVTVTGTGGVGKTSLALHAAGAVRADHPDGAWLVELAAASDPATVPDLVATVLGLPQRREASVRDRLVAYLQHQRVLLVLDNCEHLVEAVARVVDALVRGCPGVKVLATSREPIGVPGEHVRPLPPLPVPPPSPADPAQVTAAPAGDLFVRRATAAAPGFVLGPGNAGAVAEICRRLDGVPLALELAAGRVTALSPDEIAARLSARFRFLRSTQRVAVERHRTLRAVVDWSYGLLDVDERRVLDRLAVFAGSFPLAAAAAVADLDDAEAADLVARLVERSLVVCTPGAGGEPSRYALLETLRAYARERLAADGDEAATRRRHAAHHLAALEAHTRALQGLRAREAADAIARDLDELRTAHAWALDHDLATAARLVGALFHYAEVRMPVEVAGWAARTLARAAGAARLARAAGAARAAVPGLAGVHALAAGGARFRGDLAGARELVGRGLDAADGPDDPGGRLLRYVRAELDLFAGHLAEADRLAAELEEPAAAAGDIVVASLAGILRALVAAYGGDVAAGIAVADRVHARADEEGCVVAVAWARYAQGEVRLEVDPPAAAALLEDALDRARALDDRYLTGVALVSAASVRGRHGDPVLALPLFREVVGHWHRAGDWVHQWPALRNVVDLLVRVGADEPAAVLLGAVSATRRTAAPVYGADEGRLRAARRALTSRMGAAAVAAAAARGAALDDDAAVAFASAALDAALAAAPAIV